MLARSTFSGLRSVHFSWLYYTKVFFSCDTVRAYSHLHTQARSIIQMSDEQYSQYVGMLYWVDLKMWPLCSSTCRGQQSTGSFGLLSYILYCLSALFSDYITIFCNDCEHALNVDEDKGKFTLSVSFFLRFLRSGFGNGCS